MRVIEAMYNDPRYTKKVTSMINTISDGIVITDAQHRIIMANNSSALISINELEAIVGKTVVELAREGIIVQPDAAGMQGVVDNISLGKAVNFDFQVKGNSDVFVVTGHPLYKYETKVFRIVYTSSSKFSRAVTAPALIDRERLCLPNGERVDVFSYSDKMRPALSLAQKVALVDSPVFLTGESGVGKGIIAQYIHNLSSRRQKVFVHINCAAIPESLFESEVFGYEAGAFTGASKQGKQGLMELADDGTLFLDEIVELSPPLQAKLLQVLQEGVFRRVGGKEPYKLKARVISATNQNVPELILQKRFREDLYYRLCVVPIELPPLRERWEDILPLAGNIVDQFNAKYGTNKYFSCDVRVWMHNYTWPGNVRELNNVIERLAIISEDDEIKLTDIPRTLQKQTTNWDDIFKNKLSLKEATEKLERALLEKVLLESRNTREAAATLGISQTTLLRKVRKYGINFMNPPGK